MSCRKEVDKVEGGKHKVRLQMKKVFDVHESINGNVRISGVASNGNGFDFTIFSKSGKTQKQKLMPLLTGKRDVEVITTTHPSSQTYKFGEPKGIKIIEHKYDPQSIEGVWFSSNRARSGYKLHIEDPKIIADKKKRC